MMTTTSDRPFRIYRTSVVGLSLYDTQVTREGAESSVRTGQVEYPEAMFTIQDATKGGPTEADPLRPYCKPDQSCCDFCCGN
jgi:hypothetical protein